MTRVGVVTVAYNSSAALGPFLDSLRDAVSEPIDAVVADNASPDAEASAAVAAEHGARFLALPDNRGYGAGANAAIATLPADVEFVLISNPDVVLGPGALDELLAIAGAHPEAGAVGPRILDPSGDVYPSARRLPSLREGVGHVLFGRVWPGNPWTRAYRNERLRVEQREAGWLSGACLLVRTSVLRAIGGFDEGYFMYFEDVDLGARIGEAGEVNLYAPSASVTHTGAHSTAGSASRMEAAHHDSAYRYLARSYSAWYLLPLRLALRVALTVRKTLLSRRRRIRDAQPGR